MYVTSPEELAGKRAAASAASLSPRWYTVAQVAELLNFGLTKTKFLVLEGEIRSVKDGRSRRVLPEWVDEYIARKVGECS
jgi:excisionase family DNA binding protein